MVSVTGGNVDYGSGPYNVTFQAQETSVTLNISITNDNIVESDENFNVAVNPALLPIDVVIANNTGHTIVTIVDDDG